MCSKKLTRSLATLIVAVLWLPSFALGSIDSVDVDITTGAYILNGDSTEARVLLRFDLPQQLSNAELYFAEIYIPITSYIPDSSALRVMCLPLSVSWNPNNVSWNDLGDSLDNSVVADEGTHYATVEEGNRNAYFDITPIVAAWKAERIGNYGLVLFCSSDEMPYFRYSREQNSPFAKVKIYFDH
jgi:hypothetical protein